MSSQKDADTSSYDRRPGAPWARRLARAAVVLGTLGVGVSAMRALARTKGGDPAAAPTDDARPALGATAAVVGAAPPVPSAAPPPAAPQPIPISSSEEEPRPRPAIVARFDPRAARAALDALAPTLTDCRIPKGHSGKVELVFEPDGHVSAAKPLDLYVGTFGGRCVASHLKQATLPAFSGAPAAYTYVFVIPE